MLVKPQPSAAPYPPLRFLLDSLPPEPRLKVPSRSQSAASACRAKPKFLGQAWPTLAARRVGSVPARGRPVRIKHDSIVVNLRFLHGIIIAALSALEVLAVVIDNRTGSLRGIKAYVQPLLVRYVVRLTCTVANRCRPHYRGRRRSIRHECLRNRMNNACMRHDGPSQRPFHDMICEASIRFAPMWVFE